MNRRELISVLVGMATEPVLELSQSTAAHEVHGNLSLIRLIANPSSFDGRRWRLAGYLDYNGIDRAIGLYVSEFDGRNAIFSNSIDLRLEEEAAKKFIKRYIILEASFHAS